MGIQYAVMDEKGAILYRTDGFDAARISRTLPLDGGARLCVCGEEALEAENARLSDALEAAHAANAAKEIFLSSMSHDIRTPMNAIVGMTTLAKKYIDEKSRVIDALDKIETASAHLLGLINDVLDMSRINSGRMELSVESFSLSDLLHETQIIIRPQAAQRGHTLQLLAEDIEAETLYGDALRLRQVFVNILSNAVKYTKDGGNIVVRVSERMEKSRCRLIFSCRDNGIGMSEDFVRRIFEPFERVNSSTISRIEGTGLGMSIVKKLVEAMEGRIDVQSRLGEGTTVTLEIPMRYESEKVNTSALSGKRLLIIEADEKLRQTYARYLDEYGVRYTLARSAAEALSAMAEAEFGGDEYGAAIIGSTFEENTGALEIGAYLSKSHPALPLVLVSDANWEEIEYTAARSGIYHFIPLPFFRKSLINALNAVLESGDVASGGGSAYPDLKGRRVLLVEDNLINREIAKEILGFTGAEVDAAEDGAIAVERFKSVPEGHYCLILMDVQMPVMNGYQAARAIRECGRGDAGVPIYAMTANTFAEDIARARQAGMNGHIAKPIDINALMQVLRQFERR